MGFLKMICWAMNYFLQIRFYVYLFDKAWAFTQKIKPALSTSFQFGVHVSKTSTVVLHVLYIHPYTANILYLTQYYFNSLSGDANVDNDALAYIPSTEKVCQFVFGEPLLKTSIKVKFRQGANTLPDAESCFGIIILPVCHEDYKDFKNVLDAVLSTGYGKF